MIDNVNAYISDRLLCGDLEHESDSTLQQLIIQMNQDTKKDQIKKKLQKLTYKDGLLSQSEMKAQMKKLNSSSVAVLEVENTLGIEKPQSVYKHPSTIHLKPKAEAQALV